MKHSHAPKQTGEHPKEHHGTHKHTHRTLGRRRLAIAIALTGSMMVVEFYGGIISNSLALISDAGHMLTHFFALSLSYGAIVIACRPTTKEKSFGLYRIEVLAAFINGITLILITAYLFHEAYLRILSPQPIAELEMLVVAVAGLIVNLISAAILMGAKKEDLNIRSAYLHMLGDTLSSVAVVSGAVVISFTGWMILDPLLSILICVVILIWAGRLLNESVHILLESAPRHIKVDDVVEAIKGSADEIKDVHDVHIWEITSKMYSMTAHITISNCQLSECNTLLNEINRILDRDFDIGHTNLQFECA